MKKRDANLDEFYHDLADRFGALSQLFSELGSPKATHELLLSLAGEDTAAFNRFVDRVDIPLIGKCYWLQEIIERVVDTPTGFVEECWLRDNLTPDERLLYLLIAYRHRHEPAIIDWMAVAGQERLGRHVIPPGAFLDELNANHLVHCEKRLTYDTSTILVLGKPERVCV